MAVHIHPGNDTCDACEPGLAIAAAEAEEEESEMGIKGVGSKCLKLGFGFRVFVISLWP